MGFATRKLVGGFVTATQQPLLQVDPGAKMLQVLLSVQWRTHPEEVGPWVGFGIGATVYLL
jgi:hypothetical protein